MFPFSMFWAWEIHTTYPNKERLECHLIAKGNLCISHKPKTFLLLFGNRIPVEVCGDSASKRKIKGHTHQGSAKWQMPGQCKQAAFIEIKNKETILHMLRLYNLFDSRPYGASCLYLEEKIQGLHFLPRHCQLDVLRTKSGQSGLSTETHIFIFLQNTY